MIKIILLKSAIEKYDITQLVTDITWSGDENTFPRKLDLQFKNVKDISGDNLIGYDVGNTLFFYENNIELFRGYIFSRSMSSDGSESVVAYDDLIYITKSTDTVLVKNKLASDVISSTLKKFGVPIGSIQPTGHKIKKLLLDNKTISDIAVESLAETRKYTGKSYKLYSSKGKAYLVSREKATKNTISIDNIISGTNELSIEEVITQVLITKGSLDTKDSKFVTYIEKDSASSKKFGVMQHLETIDDKATLAQMKVKAKSLLKELKVPVSTVNIEFVGDSSCISGNIIEVFDDLSNISGKYYISSDSHTWSGGSHKMSLQLSKKLQ